MSLAQIIKNEASDYYANMYEVNKTAKYIKSDTRISQIVGDPALSSYLVCTALGAGTYQNPDTISFASVSGPNGIAKSFGAVSAPGIPVSFLLNPAIIIQNIPAVYNDGFTYNPVAGEIFQTFGQENVYQIDASVVLFIDNTQAICEVELSLQFFDADTLTATLISSESQTLAPTVTPYVKGISLAGQTLGKVNPLSYFYMTLTATQGSPVTIKLQAARIGMTAL